jgi:carboxyl-terminal processing protease
MRILLVLWAVSYASGAPALDASFNRLIGAPRKAVEQLGSLPWRVDVSPSLEGFQKSAGSGSIRIGSIDRPLTNARAWLHFTRGEDWIDFVQMPSRGDASQLVFSARQPHSGFIEPNWLLFFTISNDSRKESVAAAITGPEGWMISVGSRLGFPVSFDKPMPDQHLANLDSAITRLESLISLAARAVLDPAYVTFDPGISVRPEAVPALRAAGLARIWSEVKYNFVYLDRRPDAHWETLLERYLPRVLAARNDIEYGRILQEAVALLRDGHTGVFPAAVEPADSPLLILEPVERRPVITQVGKLDELKSIEPGMEIVSVDGVPVETIFQRDLDPYIFASSEQDRDLQRARGVLAGPPSSTARLELKRLDGSHFEVTVTRSASKNRDALPRKLFSPLQHRMLDGGIALVEINTFNTPAVVSDFEKILPVLLQAKAWILDVRSNGGGSTQHGWASLSHFLREPAPASIWRSRNYVPTFTAWGRPQTWYNGDSGDTVKPSKGKRFDGPVVVLTSARTGSAAEDFLIPLKMSKRATIVGGATNGSTGQPLMISIYGATARICTKEDLYPDGTEFVGKGILPDVPLARTREDVAKDRDAVLLGAQSLIATLLSPRDGR